MAYATLTSIKRYLGISESTDDTLLTVTAEAATSMIDRLTNRTFTATADSTRYHNADYVVGGILYLDGDLCAITSVTNGDGVAVASTEYKSMPRNYTPYFALALDDDSDVSWDTDSGEIAIVGKWAWSLTPPADIEFACVRLTSYLYRQKDNMGELDRAMIAGNTTLLPAELPKDIMLILAPYRRKVA